MKTIDFQPIGRRVQVAAGATLLEAARAGGVGLASLCGGIGACDSCKVRLVSGKLGPPTLAEQALFSAAELEAGYRLACQAQVLGDVRVEIPPESLSAPQRLQVEGQQRPVAPDPLVCAYDIKIAPPDVNNLRSNWERLEAALRVSGALGGRQEDNPHPQPLSLWERGDMARVIVAAPGLLAEFSEILRQQEWRVRVAMRKARPGRAAEVVALLPPQAPLLGLAIDIGTTKLAAYLCDLQSGATLAQAGAMNPQISFGEDVISRIAWAENPSRRKTLQTCLVEALNQLAEVLCQQPTQAGYPPSPPHNDEVTAAGNTAMHHLFAGLEVRQLGVAPYAPAVSQALELPASELGLAVAPGAQVYLPPNIAGYVGADHVAMLLAAGEQLKNGPALAIDIGTNTEISLAQGGRLLACSCASGPAFEGAHIQDGMRAAPGAIERVQIAGSEVRLQTIEGQPPVGICGSGILDAIAQMLEAGLLNRRGALQAAHPSVQRLAAGGADLQFVLAAAGQTGHGRDIVLTRQDVTQIQLAKAAIRTGIEVLLAAAGVKAEALQSVVVAGAFGTYINLASALHIGMFPAIPLERFQQVGNAAGAGIRQMLISQQQRRQAEALARQVKYVELASQASFQG